MDVLFFKGERRGPLLGLDIVVDLAVAATLGSQQCEVAAGLDGGGLPGIEGAADHCRIAAAFQTEITTCGEYAACRADAFGLFAALLGFLADEAGRGTAALGVIGGIEPDGAGLDLVLALFFTHK